MEETTKYKSLKIFRIDGKGKVIDITDPNPTSSMFSFKKGEYKPRYTVNYTKYNLDTNKAEITHTHWIDEDALRLLAWDMMVSAKGAEKDGKRIPLLEEYKGGMDKERQIVVSRRFSVSYKDGLGIGAAYDFSFSLSEGKESDTGAVFPVKGKELMPTQSLYVPIPTARAAGAKVLQYLQGKMTTEMLAFRQDE